MMELQVALESFSHQSQFLQGKFPGVVHLATWNGMPVAFKEFKSHVSPDGHCGDEIAITCSLDHPTLIKVLAIVDEPRGLVMELLKGR